MKTNSGAAAPSKQPHAPAARTTAPLVGVTDIRLEMLGGKLGDVRVREVMGAPGAPKPIVGGDRRGSKALWSREAVEKYLDKIIASGKWPVAQREVA